MLNGNVDNVGENIAIISMAGRFPGAKNIGEFWKNIKDGVESIQFFTDQDLSKSGLSPEQFNMPGYVKAGAIIEAFDQFDAQFFGFSPREAEIFNPQHRIFLECAWEALESAGYNADTYSGRIGVYAGEALNTYFMRIVSNPALTKTLNEIQMLIGNDKDFLATLVSYKLNLKGPGVTVQSGCSTSLLAISLACQGLRNYQCDMALAGGIRLGIPQKAGYLYKEGSILSPDGHCRPFDEKASGTVGGNGAAVVGLKRLEDALEDRDYIYAVIRGTAINNDGAIKIGYTAPSIDGQAEAIYEALEVGGIAPETIGYIEAHGTGTILGDPVEFNALKKVFESSTKRKGFCALGSVKANVGHLDAAAGAAGVIKTALAIKNGVIPPCVNFNMPNPQFNMEDSPFYVPDTATQWHTNVVPRRAGVSSFGIGGTNVHVVLEQAPEPESSVSGRKYHTIVLSAKTEKALEAMTANLKETLLKNPQVHMADVAYTLQTGRTTFDYRKVIVCSDAKDCVEAIDEPHSPRVINGSSELKGKTAVFIFPGQGFQDIRMGVELYETEEVFKQQVQRCCNRLKPCLGFDLEKVIYPRGQEQGLENKTHLLELALFTVEYAMAETLMHYGMMPGTVLGYGIGEFAAACVAGIFELEQVLPLIAGKAMGALNESFISAFERVKRNPPSIPIISGVTGTWLEDGQVNNPAYWARHQTCMAKLSCEVEQFIKKPGTYIIVSVPGNVQGSFSEYRHGDNSLSYVMSAIREPSQSSDSVALFCGLGRMWSEGFWVDWSKIYKGEKRLRIPLPTYPFERKRYWIDANSSMQGASAMVDTAGKKTKVSQWFYTAYWKPATPPEISSEKGLQWLIFSDASGLTEKIAQQLTNRGDMVIKVFAGEKFAAAGEDAYTLNPCDSEDYAELFGTLKVSNQFPDKIIHLWCVEGRETDTQGSFLEEMQKKGFYSLINIAKAVGKLNIVEPITISAVTGCMQQVGAQDELYPEKATLLGLLKVMPQEYINVSCKSIDIDNSQLTNSKTAEYLSECIIRETCATGSGYAVAYRRNTRWIQDFENVKPPEGKETSYLRECGVYLITGGLGNIGLVFAQFLAKEYHAKLVLTARSRFPSRNEWDGWIAENGQLDQTSRKIRMIRKLEELGAEVLVCCADVSNEAQMNKVVSAAMQRFGKLNGVIHAAGVVGKETYSAIKDISRAQAEDQMKPKIYGTITLEKVLRGIEIDFCLLISSLSAVLGGLGLAAYSAVNLFMDSFVQKCNRDSGPVWLSSDWDGWAFSKNFESPDGFYIVPEEGEQAFSRILTRGMAENVVISVADLKNRIDRWVTGRNSGKGSKTQMQRPKKGCLKEDGSELEQGIASIWSELLGIEHISVHDNFFELGGDSLLASQVIYRMRAELQLDIPVKEFFEYPTIKQIAEKIKYKADQEKKLAEIFDTVIGLSQEELDQLLQEA